LLGIVRGDLLVPVDRHVARVAEALGLISPEQAKNPRRQEVQTITAFARLLFPDDPARVDYAFSLWGRSAGAKTVLPDSCCGYVAARRVACPLRSVLACNTQCR
jgi:endonuclease III